MCCRTTTRVIWYTGDDIVTREPGWAGGNASRLALDETLEVRDFLNEGGRVLYTGKCAGSQYTATGFVGNQLYDPTAANAQCRRPIRRCWTGAGPSEVRATSPTTSCSTGSVRTSSSTMPGPTEDGSLLDVLGVDTPFTGLDWGFNGADSAENQNHSNSFITTSGILDPAVYPQFESWVAGRWDREGGPFEPHTGDAYVYSQIGDVSYKRLTRTIDVPAGGATMSFWTSYDTEAEWDHVAVEARTAGQDDWTTLPDVNGNTTQSTGQSCPAGWRELHPQLDHYQTFVDDTTCTPTGTTAASGGRRPATRAAGSSGRSTCRRTPAVRSRCPSRYISDWATQGLGVFVDDIEVSTGEGTTSFEAGDIGGWEITGPPRRQRAEPEQLHPHDGGRVPRGRGGGHAGLADDRLRFRGHHRCRHASRLDGPRIGSPARLILT